MEEWLFAVDELLLGELEDYLVGLYSSGISPEQAVDDIVEKITMEQLQLSDLANGQAVRIKFDNEELNATYHRYMNTHSFTWFDNEGMDGITVLPEHALTIMKIFDEITIEYHLNS